MIMRIWHGTTPAIKADEYVRYIRGTGVPLYRSYDGNCGVYLLRRIQEDRAEFMLLSLWEGYEAIRKFAGPDIEKTVYCFDRDKEFLIEMEPKVVHYEVLEGP